MANRSRARTVQFEDGGLTNSFELRQHDDSTAPHQGRVVRLASIDIDVQDMNRFLSETGRLNYGHGNAKSLGSIAVTYIKATQMGRMIEDKFPKIHGNQRKTKQLYRKLARNYQQFVRSQGGELDHAMPSVSVVSDSDEFGEDPDMYFADNDQFKTELERSVFQCDDLRWHDFSASIDGVKGYSRNALGFNLASHEELQDEYSQTWSYFRAEGFNTQSVMDRNWQAHAVFFTTYANLGAVSLKLPQRPPGISLDAPTMLAS